MARTIEIGDLLAPPSARPEPFGAEASAVPGGGRLAEILLQAITLYLLLYQLTLPVLAAGEESRAAAIALEMFHRGHLWFPVLNGEPVLDRTPLSYLFLIVSYTIFGKSELAVRLPSILFGLLQILSLRVIARRASGARSILRDSAGRFAQLALIFMPGWLTTTREGGADAPALAFILMGIAMTVSGSAMIHEPGDLKPGDEGSEHGKSHEVATRAPVLGWLAAGLLWGLASLVGGPVCLLAAIPAFIAALFTRRSHPRIPNLLDWMRAVALATLVMLAVFASWPISLQSLSGAKFTIPPLVAVPDISSVQALIQNALKENPALFFFTLCGAVLVLNKGLGWCAPDVFCWLASVLLYSIFAPHPGGILSYVMYPAAAIILGAGLLEAVRWLIARGKAAGAVALWLVVALAMGIEFGRHFRWNPNGENSVREFAQEFAEQIGPALMPDDAVGVIGMDAGAFLFYSHGLKSPLHNVRQLSESDWQDLRREVPRDNSRALRFVIAPLEFLRQPDNFPRADWRIAGQSQDTVLLERLGTTARR